MKSFFRVILLLAVVGLFFWTLWFLYQKSAEAPVVFETTTAVQKDIINKTVATGSIVPRKEIEIKPQVSGIIQLIYVEAGDQVKKDDLIAKVQVIPDMLSLNNAENRLNRAQINFDDARLNFDRNEKLFESGIIAKAEYQQFNLSYESAEEELDAAKGNLQIIREGATKKAGRTANTLIRSTVEGTILDVPIEEGNSVIESNNFNDGTTIASVADLNDMIFEGKVDESEVGKIREGMELIINIGAIENQKFTAVLEYISPKGMLDNGAIQFEIRAKMKLKEGAYIRAGYSANADIVLDKRENVLALNEALLLFDDEKRPYIEIEVGEQQFEKRDIKVGLSDGIFIEVLEGLSKEDKIKKQQ
jgi:HlyD family secretion protein